MQLVLDPDAPGHAALVIDSNPTSRSVLVAQMREFGLGTVRGVSRASDARELIEHRRYDVILCDNAEDEDHGRGNRGQELLEELRREQLLPYSTVFVMITSVATYARVSEAAEAALDSFLVKPFSANTLIERLREARQRKRELKDIFEAMEAKDLQRAADLCLKRFNQRQQYWLYAARIGAELLLILKRNDEAKALYEAVIAAKTVPWAKLGVARVQLANGDLTKARRTLEALIDSEPQFADSYDVLGKVHMEQGNLQEALATYRTAAEATPGCLLRLQHAGTLSFYAGDSLGAAQLLERTWQLGAKSRLFDVLSIFLLALLRFDAGDTKGLEAAVDVIVDFSDRYPQSVRLDRMERLGEVLVRLNRGRVDEGLSMLRREAEAVMRPDFEMESATNVISVWARVLRFGIGTNELDDILKRLTQRFGVSHATCEVLVAAARSYPGSAGFVREAFKQVMQLAEQAMNMSLNGQPGKAVDLLLHHGDRTGNAKLIEMALLVAERQKDHIDDLPALLKRQSELAQRLCAPVTHIAGVRRSNRSAGGMVLRR